MEYLYKYLYIAGEIFLVLALVGIIAVIVWMVTTAVRLKTALVTNAGRLYKRPLNAGKNLVTTGKGIAQQETVRIKHIISTVKTTSGIVMQTASEIKTVAETVHPEDLKPALALLKNASSTLKTVANISHVAAGQGPH